MTLLCVCVKYWKTILCGVVCYLKRGLVGMEAARLKQPNVLPICGPIVARDVIKQVKKSFYENIIYDVRGSVRVR